MTDYLGPLTLNTTATGSYHLTDWSVPGDGSATLSLIATGSSADTLLAAIEALAAAARPGNIWVHSEIGATNPVFYRVTACTGFSRGEVRAWLAGFAQGIDLSLSIAALPSGALQTLYAAQALSTPGALALSLLGTRAPALDVTVDDSSANGMHSVWAWIAPNVLTANQAVTTGLGLELSKRGKWLIYASTLTWTAMSNRGATATAWSNDPRYTTSSSWQTAPLNTAGYPAGTYKPLYRVKQEAGTGYVMDSQNMTAVPVTRTSFHLLEGPELRLPVSDTPYGSPANLTIYARSDGTNDFEIDAVVLIGPLNAPGRLVAYHPATPTTEVDQFDAGPSGCYLWTTGSADATTDLAYVTPGPLVCDVLSAHTGTLIATEEPSGTTWPTDWGRTDGTDVTATASKFQVATTAASKYAWYAATNASTPLVVPGEWYEVTLTRQVTARTNGSADVILTWQDIDGTTVGSAITLSTVTATDASPVNLSLYAKAPAQAARAQLKFGNTSGTLTSQWYNAVLRRCPPQLCVVVEDAAGALSSNAHAVGVTLRYTARYEVGR